MSGVLDGILDLGSALGVGGTLTVVDIAVGAPVDEETWADKLVGLLGVPSTEAMGWGWAEQGVGLLTGETTGEEVRSELGWALDIVMGGAGGTLPEVTQESGGQAGDALTLRQRAVLACGPKATPIDIERMMVMLQTT